MIENIHNVKVRKLRSDADALSDCVKRFYLPYELVSKCPTCGRNATRDLSQSYLSYPAVGEPITVDMVCFDDDGDESDCGEWSVGVQIDIKLKAINTKAHQQSS